MPTLRRSWRTCTVVLQVFRLRGIIYWEDRQIGALKLINLCILEYVQCLAAHICSIAIFEELSTSFITPFDREDIHLLADFLDDVIDRINSCAKRIAIYKPKKNTQGSKELGQIVRQDAECIAKAMDELESLRKNAIRLKAHCKELHDLENQADDVYEMAITQLFEEEKDGIEIIKAKDILSELEKATDAA